MLLPQILQSRTQIALPLLRRSIRIKTLPISSYPRRFITTPPRNEEPEVSTTAPPTEELENPPAAPVAPPKTQEQETSTTTQPESNNEQHVQQTVKMPPRIRRIITRPQNEIISPESQIQQRRVPKAYKTVVDQGYRVIRLQKFLEICRSPLMVPADVIVIKKFFIGPDGSSLESSQFEITHGDLANERRWLELRQDHEEISPIMKKLDTVSVEGDLSRYMVINKNMERLNIGITKPSRDELGKMTSVEYYFPRRIDDNIDIIKRGLGASHFILESHFGEMDAFNKLGAAELVLQQIEQLMGEINRSFRSLRHRIYHPQLSGWAGRLYKSVVNSVDKSFVIAKAILDSNFDELVSIPTPNGGEPRTISHHEALANYTQTSGRVLLKLREIIEQNRGKEPDIDYTTLRSMAGIQRRIQSNVDAIQESVGMGYVGSRSWDGKRVLKKVDALDVVIKQLDRNIRSANIVLTSLGLHPKSQNFYAKPNKLVAKEVKFTSGASVTPSQPPISHFNPDLSFSPSPITSDIPGNKREYNTISFPNVIRKVKPQALNEFGTRLPSKGLLQRLGRGDRDRGPPRKNAFGKEIPNERIVNIRPKLAIGQKSIREKMLIKEEERLKSMQGLGYSLMAADRVENGGTTIQNVVEKDINGIASMWEGSGDMGGLTDESGLAPLKKGDLCELR